MSQPVIDYLKTLPLFAGLDERELGDLFQIMGLDTYPQPGHVVFDVGDKPDGAYIVKKGICTLSLPVDGQPAREVVRLGEGAVVGELCLVGPAPRTLRLTVTEPADIIVINGPGFHRLREAGHPGAYKLLRNVGLMMCERLRDTNQLLEMEWRGLRRAPSLVSPVATQRKASAWQRLIGLFGGKKGGAA
ncbi:MAG: cyclic nucleotide-binding domain-containing protein [Myxococcales bacterium]|nr:cyclic nucleotide-binding domain-containing protein [Myxococcales bacterium]